MVMAIRTTTGRPIGTQPTSDIDVSDLVQARKCIDAALDNLGVKLVVVTQKADPDNPDSNDCEVTQVAASRSGRPNKADRQHALDQADLGRRFIESYIDRRAG